MELSFKTAPTRVRLQLNRRYTLSAPTFDVDPWECQIYNRYFYPYRTNHSSTSEADLTVTSNGSLFITHHDVTYRFYVRTCRKWEWQIYNGYFYPYRTHHSPISEADLTLTSFVQPMSCTYRFYVQVQVKHIDKIRIPTTGEWKITVFDQQSTPAESKYASYAQYLFIERLCIRRIPTFQQSLRRCSYRAASLDVRSERCTETVMECKTTQGN